ncbi:response regulator [Nocardioides pocheonensis]|uniref:histidine kinase n=2 Tax=Nocardioides pocheonensis TaxID=661485 RepID=A0A3N0GFG9_9ACTN|nr:response regulator [Nocardioides pocheonensis]
MPSDRAGLVAAQLPASWGAAGVCEALAQVLPGHVGVLVLAWTTDHGQADRELLDAAVAVVDGASARLDAEERLADLVARVDSAQHLAGMGDYDWHIPTDTNRWSDQLYRIYGYEPQSFNATYEKFLSNIHPDDRERIQGIHQQAYASGEPYQMIERIVRPDGEVRYLSSNGEVIMGEDGVPVRMRGTCIDVTERVLAERETERAAERFRGLVESSPDAILVLDSGGVVLQANGQSAELLGADPTGHALDEILPGQSWGGGGTGIEAKTLDGRPLLLDLTTAELTESTHEGRTAVFLKDAAPRLEREAMATRLGESQQRRRQALEINDNVVQGLTSAVYSLEHEDVRQASSFIERTLAAARDMMDDLLEPSGEELHPGDLVRSVAARLEHVAPREQPGGGNDDPPDPAAYRVLIVDDAEDIRALLRMKLNREERFEVVGEAADGVDAVEMARTLQPHLVLLDMAMPRMDGLQALPLIREAAPGVRVIVLSGFNQSTLEREALAAGADRYIVKGGSMRDLVDEIEKVLRVA